jgi:pimeloyl-ACP methyl ester carboxylesterase
MVLPKLQTGLLAAADGAVKPYVTIGNERRAMIVVPGAADGLRTCVDVSVYLAWFYRERVKDCRLLILSRREPIPPGFGVEGHAADMIDTVEQLQWGSSVWECLSAAGPIGQQIAVRRPDLVQGLILSSTFDHVSDRTRRTLGQWMNLAQHPAGIEAFSGMFEQKYRPPPEVVAQIDPAQLRAAATPRDPQRLIRILEELLSLDQRAIMSRIACPTLVIGGADDRAVPAEVQRQMAARVPAGCLELCPGFGHFNDMENPAYEEHVQRFAKRAADTHVPV